MRSSKTTSLFNPSRLRMSPSFKNAADQDPAFQPESSESDWLWQRAAAGEAQQGRAFPRPPCPPAHAERNAGQHHSPAPLHSCPGLPSSTPLPPHSCTSSCFPLTTAVGSGACAAAGALFPHPGMESRAAGFCTGQKRSCAVVRVPALHREGRFIT